MFLHRHIRLPSQSFDHHPETINLSRLMTGSASHLPSIASGYVRSYVEGSDVGTEKGPCHGARRD
jgi:hypothetical protein